MTGRVIDINGQTMFVREWPGSGPPLLFIHATGFHGLCWRQVIDQLPGRLAIAPDMRGHGRSSKPAPPYSWRWFGQDVAALVRNLNLEGAIGIGHSMGGHSLVLAAAIAPEAFSKLVLLDPVIMEPEYYRPRDPHPHFVRKRRNTWASAGEMFESFRERIPFLAWDPSVLRDYCEAALDGHVLACPPEIEASIYENSGQPDADLYPVLSGLKAEVIVVRSGRGRMAMEGPMDMLASPTAPGVAACFSRGRDVFLPERSHFIPMEDPAWVAGIVAAECHLEP